MVVATNSSIAGPSGSRRPDPRTLTTLPEVLSALSAVESEEAEISTASTAAHEDSVFLGSYIPRSLNEVYDPERDVAALKRGEGKNLIYADTIGLVEPGDKSPQIFSSPQAGSDESEDGESDSENENEKEDGLLEPQQASRRRTAHIFLAAMFVFPT